MAKTHVKKNDTVMVVSGREKGKRGKVLQVLGEEGRVLVEGVNVVKRHTRAKPPKMPQGGIMDKALPVPVSKVMLVCPRCSRNTRIRRKVTVLEGGAVVKDRICAKCGEVI